MDTEEKIDELFKKELEKVIGGEKVIVLPTVINVEQDDVPDIERWKTHE